MKTFLSLITILLLGVTVASCTARFTTEVELHDFTKALD